MRMPWRHATASSKAVAPLPDLDPKTQARKALLAQLIPQLLPPEVRAHPMVSPLISQVMDNLDAANADAAVALMYQVVDRFREIDAQFATNVTPLLALVK